MPIIKGISQKKDGSMKVFSSLKGDKYIENRKRFLSGVGLDAECLVLAGMEHGNNVVRVGVEDKGKIIPGCDALVTTDKDLILGVTAADCLPIYFEDKNNEVIGIAHAGWKGVHSKIVMKVLEMMIGDCGAVLEEIRIEVGPHIQKCHFEVQEDLIEKYSEYQDCFYDVEGKRYLDLAKVIKKQLLEKGILENNIVLDEKCTFCCEDCFSYRRDKPVEVEAMLAYIVNG